MFVHNHKAPNESYAAGLTSESNFTRCYHSGTVISIRFPVRKCQVPHRPPLGGLVLGVTWSSCGQTCVSQIETFSSRTIWRTIFERYEVTFQIRPVQVPMMMSTIASFPAPVKLLEHYRAASVRALSCLTSFLSASSVISYHEAKSSTTGAHFGCPYGRRPMLLNPRTTESAFQASELNHPQYHHRHTIGAALFIYRLTSTPLLNHTLLVSTSLHLSLCRCHSWNLTWMPAWLVRSEIRPRPVLKVTPIVKTMTASKLSANVNAQTSSLIKSLNESQRQSSTAT